MGRPFICEIRMCFEKYINQVIHADCMDVLPQLPDNSIDFIFTDPPYGHNNNNNNDMIANWEAIYGRAKKVPASEYRPIANDGPEADEIFKQCIKEYRRLLRGGGCCCCCCGGGPDPQFARWSLWLDEAIPFKMMVIWDKGPMGMGHHYRRSYETVLVAQVPGAPCKWYDKTKQVENIIRSGYNGIKKIIPSRDQHPTEKPIELPTHFIQLHTKPDDIVLDPFAGSGTTAIACIRTGRRYICIEKEKEYVDMANKRIKEELAQVDLFGKKEKYIEVQEKLCL